MLKLIIVTLSTPLTVYKLLTTSDASTVVPKLFAFKNEVTESVASCITVCSLSKNSVRITILATTLISLASASLIKTSAVIGLTFYMDSVESFITAL